LKDADSGTAAENKNMYSVKQLTKELAKEKYDVKNTPVTIKLPNGDTYEPSMVSIYDDQVVIETVPCDAQLENGEAMYKEAE
jgi:hypothetical protein